MADQLLKRHFEMMASYNQWANARLYAMARTLADSDYRRDVGVYFRSLHGTLNHLLVADRNWMTRLTGAGEIIPNFDTIVHDTLPELEKARVSEDARIIAFVAALDGQALSQDLSYTALSGKQYQQRRPDVLAHLFNHQTHHRGQAHAVLTILGVRDPEPLDLLLMQRLS
jgi:uncharacterized damage-inducible protein DinB